MLSADLVVNLPEAQDPQEDRRHARAQEPRRDQRRQEPAAAPLRRLGRRGRRRVSGRAPRSTALRSPRTELARAPAHARHRRARLVRWVRRAENAARGDAFIRSGNWHGNRTTWRMCLDLNRCLYYSDARGAHFDAPAPVRTRAHRDRRRGRGRGRGPARAARRPARRRARGDRSGRARSRRGAPDGLRRAAASPRCASRCATPELRITAVRRPERRASVSRSTPSELRAPRERALDELAARASVRRRIPAGAGTSSGAAR